MEEKKGLTGDRVLYVRREGGGSAVWHVAVAKTPLARTLCGLGWGMQHWDLSTHREHVARLVCEACMVAAVNPDVPGEGRTPGDAPVASVERENERQELLLACGRLEAFAAWMKLGLDSPMIRPGKSVAEADSDVQFMRDFARAVRERLNGEG